MTTTPARARDVTNRSFLRQETRDAHMRAENAFVGPHGFRDIAAYTRWLTAMHQVHVTVGLPAASRLGNAALLRHEVHRVNLLSEDLGLPAQPGHEPGTRSASWAWGAQYVLQGSALGAAMLLKSGAVRPDWPSAYLREMRAFAVRGDLNRFFAALNASTLEPAEAIRGATEAFRQVSENRR